MDQTLIESYKKIQINLLKATLEKEITEVFYAIERLQDLTEEVNEQFSKDPENVGYPAHWLSMLRFIRYSVVLKTEITSGYDTFVNTYQTISSHVPIHKDEDNLKNEISDFLYRVDAILGDHERLAIRLLTSIHEGMLEIHGYQAEPGMDFFKGRMLGDPARKIEPSLKALKNLCISMLEQRRVLFALERVRKLIAKSNDHHEHQSS